MFVLKIKANATDIQVPAVRSLLGFAMLLIILYRNQQALILNITVAILLITALLFVETLLVKFSINMILLMSIAAILVFVATHQFIFSLSMIFVAIAIKFSYTNPVVEVSEKGVSIKKTFSNKTHPWPSFNNLLLKDKLLTLDFSNNKLLQLELDDSANIAELPFNDFCARQLSV